MGACSTPIGRAIISVSSNCTSPTKQTQTYSDSDWSSRCQALRSSCRQANTKGDIDILMVETMFSIYHFLDTIRGSEGFQLLYILLIPS